MKESPPGGALAPYYTQPSEDFVSRPGTVWYPLEGKTTFPLFQEVTTAHHEGFPGHHLQVGVQMCQGDLLSRYHKLIVWLPGAGEGWALYAERRIDLETLKLLLREHQQELEGGPNETGDPS